MTAETPQAIVVFGGAYATVIGLCVGSFLNVVAHRLPRGESIVRPRSRCPLCSASIAARDNVPLLGFLLLRGRCRSCGGVIAGRYPAVEAAAGASWLAAWLVFGATWEGFVAALFLSILLVLAVIDGTHFLLPDAITYPALAIGLGSSFVSDRITQLDAAFGALAGAGALLFLIGVWYLVRRVRGMGLGDVKMLAAIGAFLGVRGALLALFVASVLGAAVGVWFLARGRLTWSSRLPFGVFLAVGGVVALFFGPRLLAAYASLL